MKNLKVFAFLFFVVLFAGCQNQLQNIGKEAKQNDDQVIQRVEPNSKLDLSKVGRKATF